jgi:hypothetical protein
VTLRRVLREPVKLIKRELLAASTFSVCLISSVVAQEAVQFPSTDADLRGGIPKQLTAF